MRVCVCVGGGGERKIGWWWPVHADINKLKRE